MKYFNNPLNIRYASRNQWKGQIRPKCGFCQFSDSMFCYRAGFLLVRQYMKRGKVTYSQIIETFAPPSENNTSSYVSFVCDKMKVFPFDIPSSFYDVIQLLYFMSWFEQGSVNELSRLVDIIDWFRENTNFLRCRIIG